MAQFIEVQLPGSRFAYVRCSYIERVECPAFLGYKDIASPDKPILLVVRDQSEPLPVYGCNVADILFGIHRDDCFVDLRQPEEATKP